MKVRKLSREICAVLLGVLAVAVLFVLLGGYDPEAAACAETTAPTPFTTEYYAGENERFGIGLCARVSVPVSDTTRPARITDYRVEDLHIGWYSDWRTNAQPLRPGGIKYAQLIMVKASEYPTNTLVITETVAANRGTLWIVGNEPEAVYKQGNRTPEEYAEIYHDVYHIIKDLDPTAWIAIGGVIEPTPLRLQWLDLVLDEYEARFGHPMPVDVWNIHVQILREKGPFEGCGDCWGAGVPVGLDVREGRLYELVDCADPGIFRQLVVEFRQWMKVKGFQDKALIISEYGVLQPSTYIAPDEEESTGDQLLITFMRESFSFLLNEKNPELGYPADENRLVQQWLWFSLNAPVNGHLFSSEDPTEITKFGSTFRDYVHVLLGLPRVVLPIITNGYHSN